MKCVENSLVTEEVHDEMEVYWFSGYNTKGVDLVTNGFLQCRGAETIVAYELPVNQLIKRENDPHDYLLSVVGFNKSPIT